MERKEQYKLSQLGVSLIELSMVVVVAALIAGSFATYKNFQHASKLRSIITEISQLRSSVSEFRDKYFTLPGDMPLASTYFSCGASCNGNGDLAIVWDDEEGVLAWHHLQLSGILKPKFTGTCSGSCLGEPGVNIPESKYPNGGYYLDNIEQFDAGIGGRYVGNVIALATAGKFASASHSSEILVPEDAKSLDVKLDDGLPANGTVQVWPIPATLHTNLCAKNPGIIGKPSTYNMETTVPACQISFRLSSF